MPEETFLVRLDPTTKLSDEAAEDKESRLRTLAGADGQVYGRASIWPDRYSSFFDPSGGWITIAGLRANRMRNVQGVLLGEAVTAARNAANPTVNTSTLATWASEQAQDRKSVVKGKRVSVRVDLGGRSIIKQKN